VYTAELLHYTGWARKVAELMLLRCVVKRADLSLNEGNHQLSSTGQTQPGRKPGPLPLASGKSDPFTNSILALQSLTVN